MVKAVVRGKKEMEVDAKIAGKIRMCIRQGLVLKRKIELAKAALEVNNERLLPFAEDLRVTTQLTSSTFRSEDGEVTVKFSEALAWEEKDMPRIKAISGPLFTTLFHEIPMFAVNSEDIPEIQRKLGKDFERLVSQQSCFKHTPALKDILTNESTLGTKLGNYILVKPKAPSFGYTEAVPETTVHAGNPRAKGKIESARKEVA